MKRKTQIGILFLILILGFFFRFWQLTSIPPGLWIDEAINANEGYLFPGRVFYEQNYGREGLFMNLLHLSFLIFGMNKFSFKLVPALMGFLTLFGFYLFAREFFGFIQKEKKEKFSLLATFFLATSFWHVNFSRIGFRAVLLPLVVVFWLYFLLLGIKTKKTWALVFSGIFFGLGFYTYSSFRLAVVFLLIIWIFLLIFEKNKGFGKFFLTSLKFFVPAFLVALPLGIYFLLHPKNFFGRLAPLSIFSQENFLFAFKESLFKHLLMFNFAGDGNWRHNLAGSPQLLWPIGLFFIIGIIICGNRGKSFFEEKKIKEGFFWLFPLLGFFVFLAPGILTYEGIPHSLRTIGTLPFVYLFASLGAFWFLEILKKALLRYKITPLLLKTLSIVFLVFVVFNQANKYFILFGKNQNLKGAFSSDYYQLGHYLVSLEEKINKYVIVNERGVPVLWANNTPMPAQTLIFWELASYGKIKTTYLNPEEIDKIKTEGQTIIFLMKKDEELFGQLKEKYPQGEIIINPPVFAFEINQ